MNIHASTNKYETWFCDRTRADLGGLELKHEKMKENAFSFLRATFYRWTEQWPEKCPEQQDAPKVLAAGDLHVENFGTWRDREGRLVWGINDFDESFDLPYTSDLCRLATSARMALSTGKLDFDPKNALAKLLDGYIEGLKDPGGPFVFDDRFGGLFEMAWSALKEPKAFWKKLRASAADPKMAKIVVPDDVVAIFRRHLPMYCRHLMIAGRRAGLGGLGLARYVGIGEWNGGSIAREVKAWVPSACDRRDGLPRKTRIPDALNNPVRVIDPFYLIDGDWAVRRLSPDTEKIALDTIKAEVDAEKLFHAMGRETANVHLGTPGAAALILADLKKRHGVDRNWLNDSAARMERAISDEFEEYKSED